MPDLVVGFDLDMTLVDSRPGISAVLHQINSESGYGIDVDRAVSMLGPPLDQLLAPYLAPELVLNAVERFRDLYPSIAIAPTVLLPGAREAMQAVHELGGRVLVLTGKFESNALLHLQELGLPYDRLAGARWADGKTLVLREEAAAAYVGDHVGDMRSARAADAVAVGVSSGGQSAEELTEAGADIVLDSLIALPDWLKTNLK